MPFPDDSFDPVVCRAAFKNFADPVGALREIDRVLKPGGTGLIIDMYKDVSRETLDREVDQYVRKSGLGFLDALMTRLTFRFMLLPRSYRKGDFERMIAEAGIPRHELREDGMSLEVWLYK